MSGRVGVEQTPDIEALSEAVAEALSKQWWDDYGGERPEDDPHRAYFHRQASAVMEVLAAAVREARAAELREAADLFDGDTLMWRPEDVQYVLRDRADRIAVDAAVDRVVLGEPTDVQMRGIVEAAVDAPEGGASRG